MAATIRLSLLVIYQILRTQRPSLQQIAPFTLRTLVMTSTAREDDCIHSPDGGISCALFLGKVRSIAEKFVGGNFVRLG